MKTQEIKELLLSQIVLMRQNPSNQNKDKAKLLLEAVAVYMKSIKVESK